MDDGDATEVGLVGREGAVDLPVLLNEPANDLESMTQCQGMAISLSSDAFRSAMEDDPALRHLMLRMPCCSMARWHGQLPAMGATRPNSASPAEC
jgi:hypothetical protein